MEIAEVMFLKWLIWPSYVIPIDSRQSIAVKNIETFFSLCRDVRGSVNLMRRFGDLLLPSSSLDPFPLKFITNHQCDQMT